MALRVAEMTVVVISGPLGPGAVVWLQVR